MSYYNINNFSTTLAKNSLVNQNNNFNHHHYNNTNNNFIDQSNFTFSNGQNIREMIYSKSDLNSNFNNNANNNYHSYTENTPNLKKNILDFNTNQNTINNQNLINNNNRNF